MGRERSGAPFWRTRSGGRSAGGAPLRRTAAALAAAVLCALAGCTGYPSTAYTAVSPHEVRAHIDAGLGLYESGEFPMAARRFAQASAGAVALRDRATQRDAVSAECVSWMRARRLRELSACTGRLEALQRRHERADPGVNTLMALGAIAGRRPIPAFRVPQAVHPIVRAAAAEAR